jgi:hypothetical protein
VKIVYRLFYALMNIIYLIMILLSPLWFWIPCIFCGVSHVYVLDKYFDYMWNFKDGLFYEES